MPPHGAVRFRGKMYDCTLAIPIEYVSAEMHFSPSVTLQSPSSSFCPFTVAALKTLVNTMAQVSHNGSSVRPSPGAFSDITEFVMTWSLKGTSVTLSEALPAPELKDVASLRVDSSLVLPVAFELNLDSSVRSRSAGPGPVLTSAEAKVKNNEKAINTKYEFSIVEM